MNVSDELLSAVAWVTGYQRHRPFRLNHSRVASPASYAALDSPAAKLEYAARLRGHVIEEHEEFVVGHIEFDDQGAFWDRKQLDTIRKRLECSDISDNGALIIVFVHGWMHNAAYADSNLTDFREVLADLHRTEAQLAPKFGTSRKIVGIYCSWRGLWNSFRPFSYVLSFWDRKETAHRVGHGGLLTALVWLEQLRMQDHMAEKESRMVVVGHSFGGTAVFSAVSNYIRAVAFERLAEEKLFGAMKEKVTGFGDCVVLVNPAFEALLYEEFDYLVGHLQDYRDNQHVVLMIVGADNDCATRWFFPIGQALKRFDERRQPDQFRKIRRSVSNWPEYATHRLSPRDDRARTENRPVTDPGVSLSEWQMPDPYPTAGDEWTRFVPASCGWRVEEMKSGLRKHHCFMMVHAVEGVVNGHNGIFTKLFMEFLRDFLIAQDLALEAQS